MTPVPSLARAERMFAVQATTVVMVLEEVEELRPGMGRTSVGTEGVADLDFQGDRKDLNKKIW